MAINGHWRRWWRRAADAVHAVEEGLVGRVMSA
jgi:hypothetical protein